MQLVVTCAAGTEAVLETELRALGVQPQGDTVGSRTFEGSLEDAYRVALWSRVASRVLIVLARFHASDAEALYDAVRAFPWEEHLGARETLRVECVATRERRGHHTRFLALKTKDAVVDRLRDVLGARPDIDRDTPDVSLRLRWGAPCTLSLDLRGPLHRRGVRPPGAPAPLRENLAAALLALSGWDPAEPLVDPMCGSGTFLVEAAWRVRDVAPGLWGPPLGGWRGHEPKCWQALLKEAKERRAVAAQRPLKLYGFDADPRAVRAARRALEAAGVAVPVLRADLRDLRPPTEGPGHLIVNPPYGQRLGPRGKVAEGPRGELVVLYGLLGDVLKERFGGWTAHVLAPPELTRSIGLRPTRRHVVFNGPLECRLASFPVRARRGAPVQRGWHREADAFANRLRKNRKRLLRWARKQRFEAFRLYDRDIPEYAVTVDVLGEDVVVSELARPRKVDARKADARLQDVMRVVPKVLGVDARRVHLRVRARQGEGQYDKRSELGERHTVWEGALQFWVNPRDYLDVGLFPDQRRLRARAAKAVGERSFLNLFAYTCSASVYAASAGAHCTSVDLSKTYLRWGEDNFRLNDLDPSRHTFVRVDARRFLERTRDRWDVTFLNPPSFSRSKAMDGDFVVSRDHPALIEEAMRVTRDVLFFSTHARGFELRLAGCFAATEITAEVRSPDYPRSSPRVWAIRHRRAGRGVAPSRRRQ